MYETEVNEMQNQSSKVLQTKISGFDALFTNKGIPRGSSVLIAGGTGTGKSTFCRQICFHQLQSGSRCMYVSFEENKERIINSMSSFGWDVSEYINSGQFLIQNINPLDILRMKFGSLGGSGSATELSSKVKPIVIPKDLNPEIIVVDSLTAVIAASLTKEKNYRVYLQQLFSFFQETGSTCLLISETNPLPTRFSESGIEEFLADGIIVFYNIQKDEGRVNALEILKMREGQHSKHIVEMQITKNGLEVYPDKTISIQL